MMVPINKIDFVFVTQCYNKQGNSPDQITSEEY